jgi:hypothetical protein
MKKILLLTAGIGALVAVAAGFAGIPFLIGIGGGAMLISLLLLPWLHESDPASPRDRADHGR